MKPSSSWKTRNWCASWFSRHCGCMDIGCWWHPVEMRRCGISSEHHGVIHMMLADVVMPHMSGRELASRLCELRPSLKVLFMSGYSNGVIEHHGFLAGGGAFIQKPFTPDTLARKIREVLDQ